VILDEDIDRVRDAADIVQIIGEHVRLKRVGNSFRGPCPFHGGTHLNFSVVPGRGFKCFVCGEGGDVFTFLQKHLGMDWPSAVRSVAERSGIPLRETEARRQEGPDPREPLWEVNALAADFFREMLWEHEAGAPGRAYLQTRRLSREVGERMGLGFAPRDGSLFLRRCEGLGVATERLLEAGLLVRRDDGQIRPRFRNRLMFSILDPSARHVGFGGRIIGDGEPKYLNSAESPVFSKGRLLYGHHLARNAIRRADRVLVVEGYFDALRLHAAGVEEAVAPLGTALTEAQARLLVRGSRNVFLLYDSDQAGLKATFRAGDELLRQGAAVRVVTFPDGEDPDSFTLAHGRDKLEALLAGAADIFERKVQILERAGWFATLDRRRRALDRLIPTIRAASDRLTRELYLRRAAEAAGVSPESLAREVSADGGAAPSGEQTALPVRRSVPDRRAGERRARSVPGEEQELLRVMVHVPAQWPEILPHLGADTFSDARARAIFQALIDAGARFTTADVGHRLPEAAIPLWEKLLAEGDLVSNPRDIVAGSLAQIRRRALDRESRMVQRLFSAADEQEQDALLEQKMEISKRKRATGGARLNPFDTRKRPPGRNGAS
jgi:DNA primase